MSKDYENTHYQPTITNNKAWEKIKKLDFDIPEGWLEKGERDSFDRIKLLAKDIKDKGTVFDIGCNIGFFAHVLQFLGNKVTGIDNDVHVDVKQFTQKSSIDTARDLNKKYGSDVEFIEDDFIKFLEGTKRSWDYVLFLSVFHHLFIGYGYSDFNRLSSVEAVKTLQLIDKHTDKALYFEMDEKVGHPYGWGSTEEVVANIKMFTSFDVVEVLDVSKDAWAEGRTLIRCSRSGKRTAPPKVIGLSSLSRRNAVGVVKGDSLFVSREANDWSAEEHPYGVDIKRVKVLKDGTVLERLKKIKHKNICEVRGYDDKWVELEYVEGELLSSAAPYLPEQRDYLSRGVGVTEAVSITEKLYDALLHLHEAGIAHTDLISFNVMMTASGEPKIIDMIGCMPLTERLKQLDLEVFWKRCAMEIFDRVAYEFLDEKSDEKLAALAWGSSKRMMSLSAKVQEIEELLTSKDAKMQELETINKSLVDQSEYLKNEIEGLRKSKIVGSVIKAARLKALVVEDIKLNNGAGIKRKVYRKTLAKPHAILRNEYSKRRTKYIQKKNEKIKKDRPLISVVITYFNRHETIFETLDSIAGQSFRDFEVIVVDDGSTNKDSIKALKKIREHKIHPVVFTKKNGGVASARNYGIEKSKGRYILSIDSDDTIDPYFIEKCAVSIETDPSISIITTAINAFGVSDWKHIHQPYDPMQLFSVNMISSCSMFRREAWEEAGKFKSELGYEDWDLWMSMAEKGYWGKSIPELLFNYRTANSSRFIEDKSAHNNNVKKIHSLHPDYRKKVRGLVKERRYTKEVVEPSTAFVNMNRPEQYKVDNSRPHALLLMPWMAFGGAETLIVNFSRELAKEYDLSFMTGLSSDHVWQYKFSEISDKIYHLPNLFENPSLYLEFVSNYITTRNVKVVHILHTNFAHFMLKELKERHPELKVIITMFNSRVDHFPSIKKYLKYIDYYTSDNSPVVKEYVKFGVRKADTRVIPNGIDSSEVFNPKKVNREELRSAFNLEDKDVAVFFIGRLSEEKNPNVFVEVAKNMYVKNVSENLKFFLVGDGHMRSELEKQMKGIGNIVYLGYRTDIAQLLSVADVFVLPSDIEGFPLSILEAMAMNNVCIASSVGAIPDIIEVGATGFVTKPGSVSEIEQAITTLVKEPDLLKKMQSKSRSVVTHNYSSEILGENYRALYKDAIDE